MSLRGARGVLLRIQRRDFPIEIGDRLFEHPAMRRRAGQLQIRQRSRPRQHQRCAFRLASHIGGRRLRCLRLASIRRVLLLRLNRLAFPASRHFDRVYAGHGTMAWVIPWGDVKDTCPLITRRAAKARPASLIYLACAAARSVGAMPIRSPWEATCAWTIDSADATAPASPDR